jgi:anti-sigma factor RsiW
MSAVSEEMLIAWIDGELDEVNRRRIERVMADDPALAERAEAHRMVRERLGTHYARLAKEPAPDRFVDLLTQTQGVVSMPLPRSRWVMGGAIAASLLLGLGMGRFSSGEEGPVGLRDGRMVAQAALADALDTQLAAAPEQGAVRIGLSFRRKGGGWCRSFDGRDMAGVACRDGDAWQVQQLLPGHGSTTAYRQASSDDPRLLATVDALIDGEPVDAAGEAEGRASGWR